MKTALAIVCSLVLVGTLFVPDQAPAAGVARAAHAGTPACCHGDMPCCAAQPSSEPQPVSAAPVSAPAAGQPLTFAPTAIAWALPATPAFTISSPLASPFPTAGAPLYAQNCARLI